VHLRGAACLKKRLCRSRLRQPRHIGKFGDLIRRAFAGKEHFIVEKDGLPVVVILSVAEYEDLMRERERQEQERQARARQLEAAARAIGEEAQRRGITEEQLMEDLEGNPNARSLKNTMPQRSGKNLRVMVDANVLIAGGGLASICLSNLYQSGRSELRPMYNRSMTILEIPAN